MQKILAIFKIILASISFEVNSKYKDLLNVCLDFLDRSLELTYSIPQREGAFMSIRYYKLFDVLQRRGLKKSDLVTIANLSFPTIAKLSKGESVNTETIERICVALNVQPGDIMEHIDD